MNHRRSAIASLLMLIALSFAVTGCGKRLRIGDLQTTSQTVELGDADAVRVAIEMGAGELDVSGGVSELLQAFFTYNVKEMNPRATFMDDRLVVKDSGVEGGYASLFDLDEFRNEWDLKFADDVPMDMTVDLGAGRSKLDLGSLALTSLKISGGAGEVDLDLSDSRSLTRFDFDIGAGDATIDLAGDWQEDLEAKITGGVGELSVRLPAGVGVRIEVDTGIGGVSATGLTRDGDTYTNAAYDTSDVTLRIDIEGGVGRIDLEVE